MNSIDSVNYLEGKIRTYESRIGKLSAQIDALMAEVSRTEALLNSAKNLLRDEIERGGRFDRKERPSQPLSERISVLSVTDAITAVVNSSPGPIHADQVLKQLREAGRTPRAKNPKNSVVSLLHRGVKSGLYDKVGPNLFAKLGGPNQGAGVQAAEEEQSAE